MEYLNEKDADQDAGDLLDTVTSVNPGLKVQHFNPDKVEAIKTRALSEMMDGDQCQSQAGTFIGTEGASAEVELLVNHLCHSGYRK